MSKDREGRIPDNCPPEYQGRYEVQEEDTMFLISQKYHITINDIIEANPHITDPNVIYPGDVLCVPKDGRIPKDCPPGCQGRYEVKEGDTMYLISEKYEIGLDELIKANPHIVNPSKIYTGDILCVPAV